MVERLVTIDEVICAVAACSGVPAAEIRGPGVRGRSRANWPRQRAVLILRRLRPDLSWWVLAQAMCREDKTTLMHAQRAAEVRLDYGVGEGLMIGHILDRLGVAGLQAYDRNAGRRMRIERQIRAVDHHAAALRDKLASLRVSA